MVRASPTVLARPAWYDRNSVSKKGGYDGVNLSPHSAIQRFSYTIPAGKKAFLEAAVIDHLRVTAATTLDKSAAYFGVTPSGGTFGTVCRIKMLNNTVGAIYSANIGQGVLIYEGDAVVGYTVDGGTGGTCDYGMFYKISEFDA